jgi:uncharacterized YigZ family protein
MSLISFEIKTLYRHSKFQLKEKGSLFIANAIRAADEDAAYIFLQMQKKEHYNATHNCFAFKFADGNLKYSDDGEPNGTAGIRILNAINHFKLLNVCVVVTRYFGRTKLGIGPLGKKYYESAFFCLENAAIINQTLFEEFEMEYDFKSSNQVFRLIEKYQMKVTENLYGDFPLLKGQIPLANKIMIQEELDSDHMKTIKIRFKQILKYL